MRQLCFCGQGWLRQDPDKWKREAGERDIDGDRERESERLEDATWLALTMKEQDHKPRNAGRV